MALTDGLVSYWKFNETSGTTAVDEISNYADATISGATLNQTGKLGTAFQYDGSNDNCFTASGLNITGANARAVWAWIYPTSSTGEQMIYASGWASASHWFAWKTNGGKLSLMGYSNDFNSNILIKNNEWSFVGVDYDGATLRLLKRESSGLTVETASKTYDTYGARQYIGINYTGTYNGPFTGKIDDIGVWNRVLTDSEITELWNNGSGLAYPFTVDVTVTPSAQALTTAQPAQSVTVQVEPLAVSAELAQSSPTLINKSTGPDFVGTGARGTRFIKTKWPVTEGLTARTNKLHGRRPSLKPVKSYKTNTALL